MKKIKITITKTIDVEVLIDETVITEECLNGIEQSFDDEIFEDLDLNIEECSRYDCGLYNYAKAAAMAKTDISFAEYITLDEPHTRVTIEGDDVEFEFQPIEELGKLSDKGVGFIS